MGAFRIQPRGHVEMTEDDTFKALSKPSYDEMYILYYKWIQAKAQNFELVDYVIIKKFFNSHNWTYKEYTDAYRG